jgi:hypothetical protein
MVMFGIILLSMAMSLSLSIVVWRMVRDDRRRSEARVQALTDLAVRPELHAASAAPTLSFAPPEQSSEWGTRAAIMACMALALTTFVLMAMTSRTRAAIAASSATQSAASAAPAPLELLSLRDTRESGTLTIAGLVGNPRGAVILHHVTITANAFDSAGTLLASGAAPIDVASLAPGDQSPFVLSLKATDRVALYRISFRGPDGRVIEHVDHRQQTPDAASSSRTEQ